jgi:PAS domain S-box-containing protein
MSDKPSKFKKIPHIIKKVLLDRKKSEKILRENEEFFRNTFEQSAFGISILSIEGVWLRVNQRLCDILGYPLDELMKLNYQVVTHPEDIVHDVERVRQMVAGERNFDSWEKRYIRKDKQVIWVSIGLYKRNQKRAGSLP